MGIAIQLLHFLRDAGFTLGDELNNTACETSQASDILGAVACSDTAVILIEIPIDHIVAAILNGPVTAIHFENALWACLFWCATGYPQSDIIGYFSGTFVKGLSLDQEYLPNMWEIEVFIQCCTAPDATGFNPAVVRRRDLDEIWFIPILKK